MAWMLCIHIIYYVLMHFMPCMHYLNIAYYVHTYIMVYVHMCSNKTLRRTTTLVYGHTCTDMRICQYTCMCVYQYTCILLSMRMPVHTRTREYAYDIYISGYIYTIRISVHTLRVIIVPVFFVCGGIACRCRTSSSSTAVSVTLISRTLNGPPPPD